MKTDDPAIIEYQVLSEDRRRAVEIYIKGVLVAFAILAFGIKLMIDVVEMQNLLVIGISGLLIGILSNYFYVKCVGTEKAIHFRLNEIAETYKFQPVSSTKYIFVAGYVGALLVGLAWIFIFVLKIIELGN